MQRTSKLQKNKKYKKRKKYDLSAKKGMKHRFLVTFISMVVAAVTLAVGVYATATNFSVQVDNAIAVRIANGVEGELSYRREGGIYGPESNQTTYTEGENATDMSSFIPLYTTSTNENSDNINALYNTKVNLSASRSYITYVFKFVRDNDAITNTRLMLSTANTALDFGENVTISYKYAYTNTEPTGDEGYTSTLENNSSVIVDENNPCVFIQCKISADISQAYSIENKRWNFIFTVTYTTQSSQVANSEFEQQDGYNLIASKSDLNKLATYVNNEVTVGGESVLNQTAYGLQNTATSGVKYANLSYRLTGPLTYDSNDVYTPIGTDENPFTGNFDGGQYAISGLEVVDVDAENIGLFGCVKGATISNVQISNSKFAGANNVGAVVGKIIDATIGYAHLTNNSVSNTLVNSSETVNLLVGDIGTTSTIMGDNTAGSNGFLVDIYPNNETAKSTLFEQAGELLDIETPTKSGYLFVGWYTDSGLTTPFDIENTTLNQNISLYAKWAEKCTVTVVDNGGSLSNNATIVAKGSSYVANVTFTSSSNQSVVVMMGGVDVTSTAYNSGTKVINIASVTGNLEITVTSKTEMVTITITESGNMGGSLDNISPSTAIISGNTIQVEKGSSFSAYVSFGGGSNWSVTIKNASGTDLTSSYYDDWRSTITISSLNENLTINIHSDICFVENSEITVWDEKRKRKMKKKVQDVTYDDLLLVWNFDEGKFDYAKPLWMSKKKTTNRYNLLKFSDGTELRTVNQHRVFCKELGKFVYPMVDFNIGYTTYNEKGEEVKLVSREIIMQKTDYYNIITEQHFNSFANGILTSCRLNNMYKIENMKFVKDNRKLATREE